MTYQHIVIRRGDAVRVKELIEVAKTWTAFSLKSDPTKFFIFRLPLTPVVKDHLTCRHGDNLAMIYVPDRERCDLCAYPCPNDQAKLRLYSSIGVR